jgi:AcrR family transcriptional regulator
MTQAETQLRRPSADRGRRERIFEAAERAFVRQGFHATTMQHIAAEAGMSPGNLYRYFRSKEAIVESLCARDQEERGEVFAKLVEGGNILGAMGASLRAKFAAEPRHKMQMVLEIWAEAGRNPAIAKLCGAIDADVRVGLAALIRAAILKGEAAATLDPDFAARLIITVVIGLFKRRAHESDFDADAEIDTVMAIITALFAGAITTVSRSMTEVA